MYLHNLHSPEEGQGHGGDDQQDGEEGYQDGADARPFITSYHGSRSNISHHSYLIHTEYTVELFTVSSGQSSESYRDR